MKEYIIKIRIYLMCIFIFRSWLREVEALKLKQSNSSKTAEEVGLTTSTDTKKQRPSLKKALFKTYYKTFIPYGMCLLLQALMMRSVKREITKSFTDNLQLLNSLLRIFKNQYYYIT